MAERLILMKTSGEDAPRVEQGRGSADVLLSGEYRTRTWNHYSDGEGRLYCGIWECTPGKISINYEEWEFCHLIEGRAVLVNEAGERWEFQAGDAFIIPRGFRGSWETVENLRKHYVILAPPP